MKKLMIAFLLIFLGVLNQKEIVGGEYLSYQSIEFKTFGGVLMRDFTDEDYTRYYDRISKRRFFGWRTTTVMDHEAVTFQKETKYVIVNEGTSSINKTYYFTTRESTNYQLSASGNIGLTTSGNVRAFRLGLDAEIEASASYEKNIFEEEKVEIRMLVDPNTTLRVEVFGEGFVTNGVAKYYRFWVNVRTGGWEVFILTTEYFSVVKERIETEEPIDEDFYE